MAVNRSKSARAPKRSPRPPGPDANGAASMLSPDWTRMAGIASLALSGLGVLALAINLIWLAKHEGESADMSALGVGIVLGVIVAVTSVGLLLGQVWTQRALLLWWLLMGALQVIAGLVAALWVAPGAIAFGVVAVGIFLLVQVGG